MAQKWLMKQNVVKSSSNEISLKISRNALHAWRRPFSGVCVCVYAVPIWLSDFEPNDKRPSEIIHEFRFEQTNGSKFAFAQKWIRKQTAIKLRPDPSRIAPHSNGTIWRGIVFKRKTYRSFICSPLVEEPRWARKMRAAQYGARSFTWPSHCRTLNRTCIFALFHFIRISWSIVLMIMTRCLAVLSTQISDYVIRGRWWMRNRSFFHFVWIIAPVSIAIIPSLSSSLLLETGRLAQCLPLIQIL